MKNEFEKEFNGAVDEPYRLEELYRREPGKFKRAFRSFKESGQTKGEMSPLFQAWDARLGYGTGVQKSNKSDFLSAFLVSGLLWLVIRVIFIEELVEPGVIILPICVLAMALWFYKINQSTPSTVLIVTSLIVLSALYFELLPDAQGSDSTRVALLHYPFFLWAVLGLVSMRLNVKNSALSSSFLLMTAESLVWTTLIYIGGGVFIMVATGLFMLTGFNAEELILKNIATWGLLTAPFIAIALWRKFKDFQLASTLMKFFSPLALLVLLVYLSVTFFSDVSPFENRNTLIVYNLTMILVIMMNILINLVAEDKRGFLFYVNFALAATAFLINTGALFSVIFRLGSMGVTPNRLSILCLNLIVSVHLVIFLGYYLRHARGQCSLESVNRAIIRFLPVYGLWSVAAIFGLPFAFGFK